MFSHGKIEDIYLEENTREIIFPSQCPIIRGYTVLIYFITGHINLYYLVKVISARFSNVDLVFPLCF